MPRWLVDLLPFIPLPLSLIALVLACIALSAAMARRGR